MHDREREERRQDEAEAAERQRLPPGHDPAVNEYRLVLRALRRPPVDGLPADFAARIARRVLFAEERGSTEDWMVTMLMLAMAGGGAYWVLPMLSRLAASVQIQLPALPWPLLVAAAVAVGLAWAFDQLATRRHGHEAL